MVQFPATLKLFDKLNAHQKINYMYATNRNFPFTCHNVSLITGKKASVFVTNCA